jgi:hypothetical protein
MTIHEYLVRYLCERGMFKDQADAVFSRLQTLNEPMEGRWEDDTQGYPPH